MNVKNKFLLFYHFLEIQSILKYFTISYLLKKYFENCSLKNNLEYLYFLLLYKVLDFN